MKVRGRVNVEMEVSGQLYTVIFLPFVKEPPSMHWLRVVDGLWHWYGEEKLQDVYNQYSGSAIQARRYLSTLK
jgi:hypothetical protein